LGVAAAAKGNGWLLAFGLIISIPMIAWSSQFVLKLIDRYPVIIYGGGALLGYVAGEMLVTEAALQPLIVEHHYLHWLVPALGAVLVLAVGRWLALQRKPAGIYDLADGRVQAPAGHEERNER
jgi:predicted tellurium resistance membrane protein TerC